MTTNGTHCSLCDFKFGWFSSSKVCSDCESAFCPKCCNYFRGQGSGRVCKHCFVPPVKPDFSWADSLDLSTLQRQAICSLSKLLRNPSHPLGKVVADGCADVSHLLMHSADDLLPFMGFDDVGPLATRPQVADIIKTLTGRVFDVMEETEPEFLKCVTLEVAKLVVDDAVHPRLWDVLGPFYELEMRGAKATTQARIAILRDAPLDVYKIQRELWLGLEYATNPAREYFSCYGPVVAELEQLSSLRSPVAKLQCMGRAVELIPQLIRELQGDRQELDVGAESLLGILAFIIVHANAASLAVEVAMVSDYMVDLFSSGPNGYALATLEVCLSALEKIAADAKLLEEAATPTPTPAIGTERRKSAPSRVISLLGSSFGRNK